MLAEGESYALWRDFLEALAGEGRVVIVQEMLEEEPPQDLLEDIEIARRQSWPGDLPDFEVDAACWGCRVVVLAARLLSDRLREPAGLAQLMEEGPAGSGPGVHYSVDLVLAVLPDLWRLASRRMADDPLLQLLEELARQWPLSGVGVPLANPVGDDLAPLRESDGLWTVFLDRVIASRKSEWARLEDVRTAVSNALGPDLREAPEYRNLLQQPEEDQQDGDDD